METAKGSTCHKTSPKTGLEPAIFGLEVQRVIHYATGAARPREIATLVALAVDSMMCAACKSQLSLARR